ncbi:acyl-CoA-binding domain-containing protein 7 isoform X1 [Ictidomys tridecemlineatus]
MGDPAAERNSLESPSLLPASGDVFGSLRDFAAHCPAPPSQHLTRGSLRGSERGQWERWAEDSCPLRSGPAFPRHRAPGEQQHPCLCHYVSAVCPALLDVKGRAKWEAWSLQKGLSKEDAMSAYISKAKELIEKYGI